MQGLQFIITTQLCTFFIADFNLIMTTAFLPTIGKKKKKNILLLQDNLLFRFKNFAPSGQLVKLSSSQIASQGCVPSLSLLPQGADYRPPHDGVRTWSPPCPPSPHWPPWDVSSLCSASWPGSAEAGLVLVEICCPNPSQSSAVGLTQFILCPLRPDPGMPPPSSHSTSTAVQGLLGFLLCHV